MNARQIRKAYKDIPIPISRFYEKEYAPRWVPLMVNDLAQRMVPDKKQKLQKRYKRVTHVSVCSDPKYLATPRKTVARGPDHKVPLMWVDRRWTLVFGRRRDQPLHEAMQFDPLTMFEDDLGLEKGGADQRPLGESAPSAVRNATKHDALLVLTLFIIDCRDASDVS